MEPSSSTRETAQNQALCVEHQPGARSAVPTGACHARSLLRRHFSSAEYQAIRQLFPPGVTITQIGHAAMVLAMLRSQLLRDPPYLDSQDLYSPCWLNGRRYLRPFGERSDPRTSYFPLYMSYAPIVFRELQELVLPRDATKTEIKNKLCKAGAVAIEQYGKLRAQKSMIPKIVFPAESTAKTTL